MTKSTAGDSNPARLFGTSGIRGYVDQTLTPELASKVALSFATQLGGSGIFLVGRDVRPQSELIQNAVMSSLSAGGVDVVDCGVAPTPAILFALKELRHQAAIVVTGSHVPAPMTGMLFFLADTGEMDKGREEQLEAILRSSRWRKVPSNAVGSISRLDVLEIYLRKIRQHLGDVGRYRVVVDPGNGAACLTLRLVLEDLGCDVVAINDRPDGTFPSRSPYPQPSTLSQLASAVRDSKADLGVGTDSDGDRALFATEHGEILWGDTTGALFAKRELRSHGGGTIITTINTSSIMQILCQEYRGILTVTKVGPPAIAEALRLHPDALFATEESGKHIWPQVILYGDAALATGKLLEIMKHEQRSLDELQNELPKFHQSKTTIPCPEEVKSRAFRNLLDAWGRAKDVQVSTLDGLKVTYPNQSWFLVRPSGTEPIFRCQSESLDRDEARKLLDTAVELTRKTIAEARRNPVSRTS